MSKKFLQISIIHILKIYVYLHNINLFKHTHKTGCLHKQNFQFYLFPKSYVWVSNENNRGKILRHEEQFD